MLLLAQVNHTFVKPTVHCVKLIYALLRQLPPGILLVHAVPPSNVVWYFEKKGRIYFIPIPFPVAASTLPALGH